MRQLALWLTALLLSIACARPDAGPDGGDGDETPRGLHVNEPGTSPGYVLYSPLLSDTTYLMNNDGQVVHVWESELAPAGAVYLLDDGHLLRTERLPDVAVFKGGGQGGRLRKFTWDGEIVWEFVHASEDYLLHHDVEPLPNGNILAIAWERKTAEEARQAGRRPELVPEQGLWPDKVIEIEPILPEGGRIVWEWRTWDHLIQNVDPSLDNYGDPKAHPERIDINGNEGRQEMDPEELEQLKALGYVDPDADAEDLEPDLQHTNAVAYNAELDQVALSVNMFDEIWIIDHSTTTAEARGSSGGRWGHGGDLLYRWGNPLVYGRVGNTPKKLGGQHDVRWIPEGHPGAGNLMIFNNNAPGPGDESHSQVLEIAPPVESPGRYVVPEEGPFGPAEPLWTYEAPGSFHGLFISGAHRLPNGNTMICSGPQGRFFEVTASGDIVWEFWTPYSGDVRNADGTSPHPVGNRPHAVFRATRIPPDHPALDGRDLKPLDPQPEIETAPILLEETTSP